MARDGTLAFVSVGIGTAQDIWVLHPGAGAKPTAWLETSFSEGGPTFSPDGRWLAYISNESGRNELYARPYPGPGEKITISSNGASEAVWCATDASSFTGTTTRSLASTSRDAITRCRRPLKVFERDYDDRHPLANFDVAMTASGSDGQGAERQTPEFIAVVLNWITNCNTRADCRNSSREITCVEPRSRRQHGRRRQPFRRSSQDRKPTRRRRRVDVEQVVDIQTTFAFVFLNRTTFAMRMSTAVMRSPYIAPGSRSSTSWVANPAASGQPVAARNCAAVMR
jgi:hypothetical protein